MTSDPANAPAPTKPKSRLRRWGVRLVRVVVVAYLLCCLLLYFFQNWLIFPGAYVHGRHAATVRPAEGREVLTLHAPDGRKVAALFAPALDVYGSLRPDAATCPTILYFYGNGDCIATSLQVIDAFRRLGCNVLCPEYIGYPMSGGKPSEAGLYATADAAWASLQTRPGVDPHKIVIVGRSLGGGAAIDLASRHRPAGLALFSAFTTMREMARKVMPMFPTGLFLSSHFDNEKKIADVTCPVFLAHGTKDDLVPFSMMGRLAARVRTKVTVAPIAGANHNDIFNIGGEAMLEKLAEFIRALPPTDASAHSRPIPGSGISPSPGGRG
jgi:hypothetical protein